MKTIKDLENSVINIYRTKFFIVSQEIFINSDNENLFVLVSRDTYHLRNRKSDREYESYFRDRYDIDGKRIHTTMYTRKNMC